VAIALRFASAAAHTEDLSFDAVVAAPSPWTRRLWRGFSLASLLSHQVARQLCIPDLPSLSRAAGPRQSKLSRAERTRNAAQGIRARAPVPPRVLLVDDVLTTGATASGCARALRAAGANEVWLATVCIAVRTQEPSGEVPAF
jgi:predicted amidophosphoribosyltransferase